MLNAIVCRYPKMTPDVVHSNLPVDILSVPVYRRFNNVKDYVAIIDAYDLLSALEVIMG